MTSSSEFSTTFIIPNITQLVSIKLNWTHYLNWIIQFTHVMRDYNLLSIVDGLNLYPSYLSSQKTTLTFEPRVLELL
jgi:hypothetical protein